jgi:hypothetical protein
VKDARRYYAEGRWVYGRLEGSKYWVASVSSVRLAKRIAAALNIFRPKVRRQKSAEKEVNPRPVSR